MANLSDWRTLEEVTREHILAACEAFGWDLPRVALALAVSFRTIYNHLYRYEQQGFVERLKREGWKRRVWSRTSRKPTDDRQSQQGQATGSTDGEEDQEAARRARTVVSG